MDVLIEWVFSFVLIGVLIEIGCAIGDIRKYMQSKIGRK